MICHGAARQVDMHHFTVIESHYVHLYYFFSLNVLFMTLYQSLAVTALAISNAAFFFVLLKFCILFSMVFFGPYLPVHSVKHV